MAGRPATLQVKITGDNRDARRKLREVDDDFDRTGKLAGRMGGLVAGGVAVGITALAGLATAAFDAASAQEQAAGAVDAVYGPMAAQIDALAAKAADAVGMSNAAYSQTAAVLGSQLRNLGIADEDLVATTDGLIRTGADLAAQFGGTTTDAVEALTSLMRGERDPIERFGVSISDATLEAWKAANGMDGLTGAADKAADTQATLALLADQTSSSLGAHARESDTAAGASQRLSAKWDDLLAVLGEGLLPIFTDVVEFIEDKILPAIEKFTEGGGGLGDTFDKIAAVWTDTLFPALSDLWDFFNEYIVPIIRDILTPIIEGLTEAWTIVGDAIGELIDGPLSDLWTEIEPLVTWFRDEVAPLIGDVFGGAFSNVLGPAISGVIGLVGDLIGLVADLIEWIKDAIEWIKDLNEIEIRGPNERQQPYDDAGVMDPIGIGGLFGSAPAGEWSRRAAELASAGLMATAGAVSAAGTLVPTYRAGDTHLTVVLDGEPIRTVVRQVVTESSAADARTLRYGVR